MEAVAHDLRTRDVALQQLKFHLNRAQEAMVKQANHNRKSVTIKVDDWVYLKIRPHKQTSMPTRIHPKLAARYYGPFKVVQQVGKVAFRLLLSETARVHPVCHVSQLKLAIGARSIEKELPSDLHMEGPTNHLANTYSK